MIDSSQSLQQPFDGLLEPSVTQSLECPLAVGVVDGGALRSVRELLTELAALEDATRHSGGPDGVARPGAPNEELLAALAREQEIIDELHRRSPEVPPPDLQAVP